MTALRTSEPYRFSGSGLVRDDGAFDPDRACALSAAFRNACYLLGIGHEDADARHTLAKIMLTLARTRSACEIIDDALVWFSRERQYLSGPTGYPTKQDGGALLARTAASAWRQPPGASVSLAGGSATADLTMIGGRAAALDEPIGPDLVACERMVSPQPAR